MIRKRATKRAQDRRLTKAAEEGVNAAHRVFAQFLEKVEKPKKK